MPAHKYINIFSLLGRLESPLVMASAIALASARLLVSVDSRDREAEIFAEWL